MQKYIIKRLLLMIPTVLIVIFIVFSIVHFMPSSPGRIILGMLASEEEVEALNEQMGYNAPLLVQYINYVGNALHGDFGTSYQSSRPVFEVLLPKFPATLTLAVFSMLCATILGIPLGILSAVKKYTAADTLLTVSALFFASVPTFFLGMMLMLIFSLRRRKSSSAPAIPTPAFFWIRHLPWILPRPGRKNPVRTPWEPNSPAR